MNCTSCGKPLAANAKFCGSCGQPVNVTDQAAAPTAALTDPATDTQPYQPTSPVTVVSQPHPMAVPTGASELPAAVPAGGGPILPAGRAMWPLAVLVFVLIAGLFVGGGIFVTRKLEKNKQAEQASTAVGTTECYTFRAPDSWKARLDSTVCSAYAETPDYSGYMTARLLRPDLTEAGMADYAKAHFIEHYGAPELKSQEQIDFAGQTAWLIRSESRGNPMVHLYVYNRGAALQAYGKSYPAYYIAIQSEDVDAALATITKSWQWKTPGGATAGKSVPFAAADTKCYSFSVPAAADIYGADDCLLNVKYGVQHEQMKVLTSLGRPASLADVVTEWKRYNLNPSEVIKDNPTLLAESDITISGIKAKQILYRQDTASDTRIAVLVHVGPKYRQGGSYAEGFEFEAPYSTDEQRKVVDAALKSWSWK